MWMHRNNCRRSVNMFYPSINLIFWSKQWSIQSRRNCKALNVFYPSYLSLVESAPNLGNTLTYLLNVLKSHWNIGNIFSLKLRSSNLSTQPPWCLSTCRAPFPKGRILFIIKLFQSLSVSFYFSVRQMPISDISVKYVWGIGDMVVSSKGIS